MSKSPNDLNNYDDISLDPITGEAQTLTDVDNVYAEQEIGADLLRNLENFEAKTAPLSKNDFVDKIDNKDVPSLSTQQTEQKQTEQKQIKKTSFHSSKTTTSQNNSLIKVVLSIAITLIVAAGAAVYTFLSTTNETSDLTNTQPTEVSTDQTQVEQFVDSSNEIANFVRKSASKLPGLTIEEALATNLNITYGRTWQILGWKVEQAEGNLHNVRFVYKQDERKEISWKVDLQARKLIATSQEAELITLTTNTSSNNNNVIDTQSNQPTK